MKRRTHTNTDAADRPLASTTIGATPWLISAATAFSLTGDQVLYAVLPVIHGDLGLSAIQVGILLSANRWIRLLTNGFAHRAAERYPARLLLSAALALGAATTALYAVTSAFTVLLAARLLWGLAWSFIRHAGVGAVMRGVPATAAGRAMGFYNGLSRVGSAAGLFGGALLVDGIGFHATVLVLAGISLLGVPLALRALDSPLPHRDETPSHAPWFLLVLGTALGAVPSFVLSTLGASISSYAEVSSLIPAATLTGAVLATRYVIETLAAPVLGQVFDSLGLPRATWLSLAGGGVLLALASSAPAFGGFIACIVLFFGMTTLMNAGLGGSAGLLGSGAFARFASASDLGAAAGPLLAWVLVAGFNDPFLPLAAAGALSIVTTLIVARRLRSLQ